MTELVSAAQLIKTSTRLSEAEVKYLVAYAVQYWERSADRLGVHRVTKEVAEALSVEAPIELGRVSAQLRRNFPLIVPFVRGDMIR